MFSVHQISKEDDASSPLATTDSLSIFSCPDWGCVCSSIPEHATPEPLVLIDGAESLATAETFGLAGIRRCCVHFDISREDLPQSCTPFLQRFLLKLIHTGVPFTFVTPLKQEDFQISRIRLHEGDGPEEAKRYLDVESVYDLLSCCSLVIQADELTQIDHIDPVKLRRTAIEEALAAAFDSAKIIYFEQQKIDKRFVDFLLPINQESNRSLKPPALENALAVEADGAPYHSKSADAKRDAELRLHGLQHILHIRGSAIWASVDECVENVKKCLSYLQKHQIAEQFRFEIDNELDLSQTEAVKIEDGPVQILAPAGSGKTKVLVNRVKWLLSNGISANTILCLAFNTGARKNLIQRLAHFGIPVAFKLGGDGVAVHTFNSFGRQILIKKGLHQENGSVNKHSSRLRMRNLMQEMDLPQARLIGYDPVDDYLDSLTAVRRDLQPPHMVDVEIPGRGDEPKRIVKFESIFNEYCKAQIEDNQYDFDDQIYYAIRTLLADQEIRNLVQRKFDHVLVDEYQDLNESQHFLAATVARPQFNLFVVGDDDQMIYGFRGATVNNTLAFCNHYPLARRQTLNINYRCGSRIVEHTSRLIAYNKNRVVKETRAKNGAMSGEARYSITDDFEQMQQSVVKFLKTQNKKGVRWQDIAILCRYNAQLLPIAATLSVSDIPFSCSRQNALLDLQTAKQYIAYINLSCIYPERNKQDVLMTINAPNRYISTAVREAFAAQPLGDSLEAIFDIDGRKHIVDGIKNYLNLLERLHARFNEGISTKELLLQIEQHTGLSKSGNSLGETNVEQDMADPATAFHALLDIADGIPSVRDFMKWVLENAKSDVSDEEKVKKDGVVVETIHKVKGREFSSVIVYDYNDEGRMRSEPEIEEERRVFYVAMTRGSHSVLVTGRKERMHPFILQAAFPPYLVNLSPEQLSLRKKELQVKLNDLKHRDFNIEETLREKRKALDYLCQLGLVGRENMYREQIDNLKKEEKQYTVRLAEVKAERPVFILMRWKWGGRSLTQIERERKLISDRLLKIAKKLEVLYSKIETCVQDYEGECNELTMEIRQLENKKEEPVDLEIKMVESDIELIQQCIDLK